MKSQPHVTKESTSLIILQNAPKYNQNQRKV